jgi:hypothetical protein
MRSRSLKHSPHAPCDQIVLRIILVSGNGVAHIVQLLMGRQAATVLKKSSSMLSTIIVAVYGTIDLPSSNAKPEQHGYSKYYEE